MFSIKEIAKIIDARVAGDPQLTVTGVSSFDNATVSDITFAADAGYLSRLDQTRAGAVIVPSDFEIPASHPGPCLLVTGN
ncbi:MAG: LpxD N-terminal domain-containing protein, partial [Desulfotignum sp.]